MNRSLEDCPEGLRHGPADRAGRCPWCRRRFTDPLAAPRPRASINSDIVDAYRRFWDPDWGSGRWDSDPCGTRIRVLS